MAHEVEEDVEAQTQDAFDEIEAGDKRQIECGRNAPRYGEERYGDAEEQNKGEAPEEVRHGKACAVEEIDAGLGRRAAIARRNDGEASAQGYRDDEGQRGELECCRQTPEDQSHHVLAKRDGGAEIAVQGAAEPDPELRHDRLV